MCAARGNRDVLTMIRSERREALDQLVQLLYAELRAVAHRQLIVRRRPSEPTPTLATTALVNEVYLKLVDQTKATWEDHVHFLCFAAVAMRNILIDRARERSAKKRGGKRRPVTLPEDALAIEDKAELLLEIDDALRFIEKLNPRIAQVVINRFYGGLRDDEIAALLGITVRTVQRDWEKAQLLLGHALAS